MFQNRSTEDMSSNMDIVEPETGPGLDDNRGEANMRNTSRSPSKARSLSDGGQPTLSPSPKFREPAKPVSKDDSSLSTSPTTPRRPAFPRGLSLQMPQKVLMPLGSPAYTNRVPLSPKLDQLQTYGSPTSVLPRRSRGLDFSRAATNLHHSTLAEQSSPDSSPTITGRAMNIPNRKNAGMHFTTSNMESSFLFVTNQERMTVSNSLGSVNMMVSDSDGSSSDDDDDLMDADDIDDSIITTPQINKMAGGSGFGPMRNANDAWSGKSPAANSLMNFQRARLRMGKNRKGPKGASTASPASKSPPAMRNIEWGVLGRDTDNLRSRRESISWAANQLHISGSESDDGALKSTLENVDGMPSTPGRDGQRGVIRRAVTRRGNMLPKTKGFARIQAALAEEGAPIETEVRREAEVVRQTRESDMDLEPSRHPSISMSDTPRSSPILGPTQDSLEGIPEDDIMADAGSSQLSSSFKQQVIRNSKGKEFWESFSDENNRTPPPPSFNPRGSCSGMSEDISIEFPLSTPLYLHHSNSDSSPSRSSTPQASEPMRKITHKRRRDDDLDPTSFKRRAVSPGMSVHNSPVMQSPMQRDSAPWAARPTSNGEAGNGKSGLGNGNRRVGFQGMVDTSDGLMKMSIE